MASFRTLAASKVPTAAGPLATAAEPSGPMHMPTEVIESATARATVAPPFALTAVLRLDVAILVLRRKKK